MGSKAELVDRLRGFEFLKEVSPATVEAIAAFAEPVSVAEGDPLYQLGEDAEDVFLVEQGRVRFAFGVGNRSGSGNSVFESGDVIGWAALLENQPRRLATAVCLEDCQFIRLNGDKLLAVFDGDTAAGYAVMRRLATRIAGDLTEVLSS